MAMVYRIRSKKREFRRGKIANFCWAFAFLFLLLPYWWVMSNFVIQDFWDPQYAFKRETLQARMKEYPNHPLWLVMGSSHTEWGLRPDVLVDRMNKAGEPLIVNFGQSGADLFRQFICFRRLIADGIKPQRVVIEIVGQGEKYDLSLFVTTPTLIVRARWDELGYYYSYGLKPEDFRSYWQQSRINPIFKYGMRYPHQTLFFRLIPIPFIRQLGGLQYLSFDKWGWHQVPPAPIPKDDYCKGLEDAFKKYQDSFQDFKIAKNQDRVVRQIIDLCKETGIDVIFLWAPEAKVYQKFYPPEASAAMEDYFRRIKSEYGVQTINARSWIEDEGFLDGHHLNATGAEKFTKRFAEELFKSAKPHVTP